MTSVYWVTVGSPSAAEMDGAVMKVAKP